MTAEHKIEFDFGQGDSADNAEAPDFSGQEPLGSCPKCGNRVFDHGVAYVCEKSVGPERSCDFRSGKIILQQPVEREQMQKLLSTGRTELLPRFISKRGRPFKAYLVKTPGGKVGFEFMARPERKPKSAAAEAAAEPAALPAAQPKPAAPAPKATAKRAAKTTAPAENPPKTAKSKAKKKPASKASR